VPTAHRTQPRCRHAFHPPHRLLQHPIPHCTPATTPSPGFGTTTSSVAYHAAGAHSAAVPLAAHTVPLPPPVGRPYVIIIPLPHFTPVVSISLLIWVAQRASRMGCKAFFPGSGSIPNSTLPGTFLYLPLYHLTWTLRRNRLVIFNFSDIFYFVFSHLFVSYVVYRKGTFTHPRSPCVPAPPAYTHPPYGYPGPPHHPHLPRLRHTSLRSFY